MAAYTHRWLSALYELSFSFGDLFIMGSVISWAVYSILLRRFAIPLGAFALCSRCSRQSGSYYASRSAPGSFRTANTSYGRPKRWQPSSTSAFFWLVCDKASTPASSPGDTWNVGEYGDD